VGVRLDIVEPCRLDQRGDNGPAFGPTIRTREEMVLSPQPDGLDRAREGVRANFDAPVSEKEAEPLPVMQRAADRRGKDGFGRGPPEFPSSAPFIASINDRLSARQMRALVGGLPRMRALIRWCSAMRCTVSAAIDHSARERLRYR
jgi:hypothetical protein